MQASCNERIAYRQRRQRNALATITAAFVLVACAVRVVAAEPGDVCTGIDEDSDRLACYDRAHGRSGPQPQPRQVQLEAETAGRATSPSADPANRRPNEPTAQPPVRATSAATKPSPLAEVWEHGAAHRRKKFRLRPHRASYFLPVRYSDRPNLLPNSPALDHSVTTALPIKATEAKFQFSFKVKAWENLFDDNGDVWLAFTQQSNWQMFSSSVSSPFRETNYEPEVIVSLRTQGDVLGWRWRALNLGFVHQSNGRSLPISRSWNRVYAQFGLERGNYTLLARPWLRMPEKDERDDNPDIRQFLGSGDVRLAYVRAGHVISALGRYSVSGKRGALQLDWAYPVVGALKGYLQVTSGYGESLVDYNQSQNTVGIGILLLPWQ
ncbi:MAG: phospholipase A [Burkholderiaceae bacterium]|nr:phospholipase A [Burkholderiaceae bacterium]MDH3460086.1 phospholipase A [Burkholderiaceae bacterium]